MCVLMVADAHLISVALQLKRLASVADACGSLHLRRTVVRNPQQQRFDGMGPLHSIQLELEQLPESDLTPLANADASAVLAALPAVGTRHVCRVGCTRVACMCACMCACSN